METGNFREDLFYRLNVVTVEVPPLRNRKDDIALLARYFIHQLKTDFSSITGISDKTMSCFYSYDWPGNIRELQNVITRAIALGKGEEIILSDLPHSFHIENYDILKNNTPHKDTLAAYEQEAILNALRMSLGNRNKTAKVLDIGEATLYRKLKIYGINANFTSSRMEE